MLFDGSVPRAKRTSASNPVKAAVLGNCFGSLCVLRTPFGCEKRRPACKMRGWSIQWAHEIRTWQYESVNHVNRGHLLLCLRSCDCRPVLGATEIHYTMLMDLHPLSDRKMKSSQSASLLQQSTTYQFLIWSIFFGTSGRWHVNATKRAQAMASAADRGPNHVPHLLTLRGVQLRLQHNLKCNQGS